MSRCNPRPAATSAAVKCVAVSLFASYRASIAANPYESATSRFKTRAAEASTFVGYKFTVSRLVKLPSLSCLTEIPL